MPDPSSSPDVTGERSESDSPPLGKLHYLLGARNLTMNGWWSSLGRAGDLIVALLHYADSHRVPVGERISVSPDQLSDLCGVARSGVYRWRDRCEALGILIVFKSQDRHESAEYLVDMERLAQVANPPENALRESQHDVAQRMNAFIGDAKRPMKSDTQPVEVSQEVSQPVGGKPANQLVGNQPTSLHVPKYPRNGALSVPKMGRPIPIPDPGPLESTRARAHTRETADESSRVESSRENEIEDGAESEQTQSPDPEPRAQTQISEGVVPSGPLESVPSEVVVESPLSQTLSAVESSPPLTPGMARLMGGAAESSPAPSMMMRLHDRLQKVVRRGLVPSPSDQAIMSRLNDQIASDVPEENLPSLWITLSSIVDHALIHGNGNGKPVMKDKPGISTLFAIETQLSLGVARHTRRVERVVDVSPTMAHVRAEDGKVVPVTSARPMDVRELVRQGKLPILSDEEREASDAFLESGAYRKNFRSRRVASRDEAVANHVS